MPDVVAATLLDPESFLATLLVYAAGLQL